MNKINIQKELLYLGIKPSLKGFEYIAKAIELYEIDAKMTNLYIWVAREYKTKATSVERAIRNAKEVMLNEAIESLDEKIFKRYGISVTVSEGITNSDFIALMKFAIENMETKEEVKVEYI